MPVNTSEANFERLIEATLVERGYLKRAHLDERGGPVLAWLGGR